MGSSVGLKYKHGDRVWIKVAKVFHRVGYDNNVGEVAAEISRKHARAIDDFLDVCGLRRVEYGPHNDLVRRVRERVIDKIAYAVVRQRGFKDGDERKLYTLDRPEFQDCKGMVTRFKFVQTGTYNRGYGDAEDFTPPWLSDVKVHRLVEVYLDSFNLHVWIQAENCNPVLEVT